MVLAHTKISLLLDQNMFEHSDPSPDIDSISAHKSNDESTIKVSYGSVNKTESSDPIDIAQTLLSGKKMIDTNLKTKLKMILKMIPKTTLKLNLKPSLKMIFKLNLKTTLKTNIK